MKWLRIFSFVCNIRRQAAAASPYLCVSPKHHNIMSPPKILFSTIYFRVSDEDATTQFYGVPAQPAHLDRHLHCFDTLLKKKKKSSRLSSQRAQRYFPTPWTNCPLNMIQFGWEWEWRGRATTCPIRIKTGHESLWILIKCQHRHQRSPDAIEYT